MKVEIEKHSKIDKSFKLSTEHLSMKVDFDDVNHQEVNAATKVLKELIEKHWDEEAFRIEYKKELIKRWNDDKWLREDYEDNLNQFLIDMLGSWFYKNEI